MKQGPNPSQNLLAQAGLITNEAGRVFEPAFGRLELPWLLDVSRETSRQARERIKREKTVDGETKMGWFIASTEAEFAGLKELQKKDWRRALKAWAGGSLYNVHNRATLHRALFFCRDSERPDAHIRECLRLYHHLSELDPKQTFYRFLQEDLVEHLTLSVQKSHQNGDDESASRSLKVLAQTVGMVGVSHLQESFFGEELESLRRTCARLQTELLAYQGQAHPPPPDLLEASERKLSDTILPEASRFSHKLVDGSKERREVEQMVAQACGVLSQAYVKAKDTRGAKKWLGEAMRWEPSAVQEWCTLPEENFGDEESADVCFPERQSEREEAPTPRGNHLLGVQSMVVSAEVGKAREEWLESAYAIYLPVFPLRRFAAYRNLESGEVGYFLRLPLTTFDHLRQGLVVLFASFLFTVALLAGLDAVKNRSDEGKKPVTAEATAEDIEKVVTQLKKVAQQEAKLSALSQLTPAQENELKTLRVKRVDLIKELEQLEKSRKE